MRGARGSQREVYLAEARSEAAFDADPQEAWTEGGERDLRVRRSQRVLGSGRVAGAARRVAVVLGSLAALAIVLSIERTSRSSAPAPAPVAPAPLLRRPDARDTRSPRVSSLRAGASRGSVAIRTAVRMNVSKRSTHARRTVAAAVPALARSGDVAVAPTPPEFGFER